MPTLRRTATVDDATLASVLRARSGLVAETPVPADAALTADTSPALDPAHGAVDTSPALDPAHGAVDTGAPSAAVEGAPAAPTVARRWVAAGPVQDYRREVDVVPTGLGWSTVTQVVSYRIAVPLVGWLIAPPARRRLGRLGGDEQPPWWGPPAVLDDAAWTALAALGAVSAAIGYLSTLLTQTITYSALEYRVGTAAQGIALAVARADIVVSIALVTIADRKGRRIVVLVGAGAGSVLTALGALAPSLAWLTASQVLARGFVTAASIAAAVLVAEVMPKGARAWAVGIVAMASAVGAGVCVVSLPLAGIGLRSWRLLYLGALLWLGLVGAAGRHLEESSRFVRSDQARRVKGRPFGSSVRDLWGRRLALLAGAFFLLQMFITPATQFRNEYLRHERGFSPTRISLYTVITVLPGGIGIVIGGRLSDTRGRRVVGIAAVLGVAIGGVAAYWLSGWSMWVASAFASLTGAAVIPALSVYGPELFGTERRGVANGVLTGAGRVGSVIGLLLAGILSQRIGRFGPAFGLLAAGPILLAVLIAAAFPETARRSLEDLNHEDSAGEEPPIQPGASVHSTG